MKVLLSIKPEFAEKIFNGSKRFEYRRSIFKNPNIKTIVVYASYPVQKVIGEFDIDEIINTNVNDIWRETSEFAGISKEYFMNYFIDRKDGYAIKVKKVRRYKNELNLKEHFGIIPPQSFVYLENIK